ncbi:kinase-like domain-containing protein [Roridomyces roridus]|uniref:Kinase-like domain-containing protein n=1 Tax=Roridomyces roridus TaxID=1738132 RepID=A0AAD7CEJ4_9AGAR|nr:kinase-like domain-containing protein [Roridomyces roridus]
MSFSGTRRKVFLMFFKTGFFTAAEDIRKARRIVRKLSESSDRLPSSLFIDGVAGRDMHPTCVGGFADVFRACHGNKPVALKQMRYLLQKEELRRVNLRFCREALLWRELHHPYILPFVGIYRDSTVSLCMVSPWMEHGTVLAYLKEHGHSNVDKLLFEAAQGLHYLHSQDIVHGDLRGANILIKEDCSACLSDFGLSSFTNLTASLRNSTGGGSIYWMAPELIYPERFGLAFSRTPASDVYAFACVCVELYTLRHPFGNLKETAALLAVINGERPERPSGEPAMSNMLWKFVSSYWVEDPVKRPTTAVVARNMAWPILRQQKALPPPPDVLEPSSSATLTPASMDARFAFKTPPTAVGSSYSPGSSPDFGWPDQHQRPGVLRRLFGREKPQKPKPGAVANPRLSISERDEESDLTRKIGWLTGTGSEDWALIMDVCNHASFDETNAQEAAQALRRDIKYGEPVAQFVAARFFNAVEGVVVSPATSPIVRERLLVVVAAAAYASDSNKNDGFRKLWKRIKPPGAPEDGMPFKDEDPMFSSDRLVIDH